MSQSSPQVALDHGLADQRDESRFSRGHLPLSALLSEVLLRQPYQRLNARCSPRRSFDSSRGGPGPLPFVFLLRVRVAVPVRLAVIVVVVMVVQRMAVVVIVHQFLGHVWKQLA